MRVHWNWRATDCMPEDLVSRTKLYIRVLRAASAVVLAFAFLSAVILIVTRLIHLLRPGLLPWNLKSAVPLILIGTAFGLLQFSLPRTRTQVLLGLCVSCAFILWGLEQFIPSQSIASSIDDLVVFLFVLDLTLVIYGHLKSRPVSDRENCGDPFDFERTDAE